MSTRDKVAVKKLKVPATASVPCLLCLGTNARSIPVKRAIAFRSDLNVLIQENRSLFDVDFTIGDGILRFARMDCSDLWVPGHSGVAAGRCDRARSAQEPVETALLDTNTSSEKPINPMANGSRVSQAFQYKECTGLRSYFRHCAPCSLDAPHGSGHTEPLQIADLIGGRWHGF
jgi:hypothetical protein